MAVYQISIIQVLFILMFGFQSFVRGATRMAYYNSPIITGNKFALSCAQKLTFL